ncbi:MAG: LysM peptidoglycan-binding domain-containing protein [Chloroflexi bacterium]|nr:LysM peptidoglycan-binding domain-containing protein [Chloroflexota bacterium]
MAERAAPIVVTPHACPFLALDGDRDRRLDVPDPLHRCFAEQLPRPRSIGHQERYCLSAAFTSCPIFLDWAGRVGAETLPVPAPAIADGTGSSGGSVAPGTGTQPFTPGWAAPPPWVGEGAASPADRPADEMATRDWVAEAGPPPDPLAGLGAASVSTHAVAVPVVPDDAIDELGPAHGDRAWIQPDVSASLDPSTAPDPTAASPVGGTGRPPGPAAAPAPSDVPGPSAVPGPWGLPPAAAGHDAPSVSAASPSAVAPPSVIASRSISEETAAERSAELAAARVRTDLLGGVVDPDMDPHAAGDDATDGEPSADDGSAPTPPWSRGRPGVPIDAMADPSVRSQARPAARTTGSREWEGARRFEAYAATSQGLPRPLVIGGGIGILALVLLLVFLLPSAFMGGGADESQAPDPSASVLEGTSAPRVTARPTATPDRPEATPRGYRVRSGDTLTRIARRFGVSVEVIQCANRIRNPDSLSVGQRLVIPPRSYRCTDPTEEP